MIQKVTDFIADFFASKGISECFTVTGGGAMHLNDSFGHHPEINSTYNHHEQACSMAAEGYARVTNIPGIVCITSGPGATNTITGVVGAWLDSIPMIVISGQMKYTNTIRSTDVPLRQLGFQEFNIVDSVSCMTKYCEIITDPQTILYHLEKALHLATSGRPGPIWLDIPMDVQAARIDTETVAHYDPREDAEKIPTLNPADIQFLLEKIHSAKKPVILAGNGIRLSGGYDNFLKVIEILKIPIVTAWNAHDLIWDSNPHYCGRPGTVGNRGGNFVVQNSDLLISFGCRMNIRQISYEWKNFAKDAYKIAIDIDKSELQKPTLSIDYPIHADMKDVLESIVQSGFISNHSTSSKWHSWCRAINDKYPVVLKRYYEQNSPVNVYLFMKELSDLLDGEDIIVTSNGAACVCSFQAIEVHEGERMFTNAGASSMGYGIAAAIGAARSSKNGGRIICLEGDGSIQMNLQELQTIVHNQMNIKIFWINNDGYHSIRQTQSSIFEAETRGYCGVSSESGISFPQAEKIAKAYDIPFVQISTVESMKEKLLEAISLSGPVICEIITDPSQDFEPKLTSKMFEDGSFFTPSLEDMYPFLSQEEMRENVFTLTDTPEENC